MTKKALYIPIALLTLVGFVFINAEKADAYAPCWEQQISAGGACHASVDELTADWLDANQARLQINVSVSFAAGGSTSITGVSDLSVIGQYQPYYSFASSGNRFDKTYPSFTGYYDLSSVPNGTTFHITFNVVSEFGGNPGSSNDSKTIAVTIKRSPTCSLSFSPSTITRGESTTAYWTSTNDADNSLSYSCTGDIGSGTLTPANSNTPVAPTQSQTCTLTAINSAGVSKTCSASITVNVPQTPAPTATLTANPTSVAPGGVPIMSWGSTNAANCSVLAGAGFHTGGAVQGSCNTTPGAGCPSPLAGTTTFSIRCYEFADKTGRTADAAVTVTVVRLNASAVGECQQNYPSSAVQSYISWNAVPGAASYTVKESRFLLDRTVGTTSGTSVIDRNVSFGSSYNYYVIAYDGSGKEIIRSSVTSATTPASCSGAPACSGGTYVISPFRQPTTVGNTTNFTSLYDPDGGGNSRYGNFNVTNSAPWVSDQPNIASSQGGGVFRGESAGSAQIHSTFCTIPANGWVDVNNPPEQPDFTCSVSPSQQDVQRPGSTSYTISVTPSNGFDRNVTLSVSGLPSGVSKSPGSPSPATILGGSGNSTLNLNVSSSAGVGLSTFTVDCKSGSITRSPTAKINVTVSGGGLSCNLSADSASPPNVSISIAGGTGNYKCNFPEEEISGIPQYSEASCKKSHSSGCTSGVCRITAGVWDEGVTPRGSTSCSINVNGSGPQECHTPNLINVSFYVWDPVNKVSYWTPISDLGIGNDPHFVMSKDGANFSVDRTTQYLSPQSPYFGGNLLVSRGEYKFVSWNSPDSHALDSVLYNWGQSNSIVINNVDGCSAGGAGQLQIYLKKVKDLLIIDSYLPKMSNDSIVKTIGDDNRSYCEAQPGTQNVGGMVVNLMINGQNFSLGYGKYQFGTSSDQLPYGNYSISNVEAPSGYSIATKNSVNCIPHSVGSIPGSSGFFSQIFEKLKSVAVVKKVLAQISAASAGFPTFEPTITGYRIGNDWTGNATTFKSAQGGKDIYVHTYLVPKTDFCTLSGPGSVLPGMSAALSWICSKPPKTCSLTDSKGNTLVSNKVYPATNSTSTKGLTEKMVFTLTCGVGVDPSSVTVNVGYAPVIREIIPR